VSSTMFEQPSIASWTHVGWSVRGGVWVSIIAPTHLATWRPLPSRDFRDGNTVRFEVRCGVSNAPSQLSNLLAVEPSLRGGGLAAKTPRRQKREKRGELGVR
jgi:hypothetical protein